MNVCQEPGQRAVAPIVTIARLTALTALVAACAQGGGGARGAPVPAGAARGRSSPTLRGGIIEPEANLFCFKYFDVLEPDSQQRLLQERGFHGGGPSWEGIIYGLLKLKSPATLAQVDFDAEVDGLSVCSNGRGAVETVQRLVSEAKSDEGLLLKALEIAEADHRME